MRWALVFLAACSAKPAPVAPPAPPPPHPRAPTPESDPVVAPKAAHVCMGRGLELASDGSHPVVCSYTECGAYGEEGAPPVPAPKVAPIDWPARTDPTAPRVCRLDDEGECRDLGKRAAAAYHKQTTDDEGPVLSPGIHDLSAVAIGTTIWDVTADRGVPLRSPAKGLTNAMTLASVGSVFVAGWTKKGAQDMCTSAVVVDAHGVNHGATFPGGALAALDDQRFVVAPQCGRTLTVVEMATGKTLGTVELPDEARGAKVQRVDAHTAALLWVLDTMEAKLAWIHIPDGQPPALGKTITIPRCPAGVQ